MSKTTLPARRNACNTIGGVLLGYAAIMFIATTVTMLFTTGLDRIVSSLGGSPSRSKDLLSQVIDGSGPGYILSSLLMVLVIRLWKGQGYLPRSMQKRGRMSLPLFLAIVSVFMSVQAITTLLFNYTESILNHWGLTSDFAQTQASGQTSSVSMFLYVGIFAPVVEELMFRGAIFDTLQPFGKRFAMVSSALLFGLFHGNLIQIPFAFLVGLILSYVRVNYGLLWCIVLHFINNCIFAELLALYGNLSNILLAACVFGALITLTIRGNHLRHTLKAIPSTERGAYRDLLANPLTIILLGYCLLSTLATIVLL